MPSWVPKLWRYFDSTEYCIVAIVKHTNFGVDRPLMLGSVMTVGEMMIKGEYYIESPWQPCIDWTLVSKGNSYVSKFAVYARHNGSVRRIATINEI